MNDKTKTAATAPVPATPATPATPAPATPALFTAAPATPAMPPVSTPSKPRLGTTIFVQVAPGRELMNCDTGQPFVPGKTTEVLVTITTLRRLADGDFIAAQPVSSPL